MLTPQIVAQVRVVQNARRRADQAYHDVMAITPDFGLEKVERLADVHSLMVTALQMEERQLLAMIESEVSRAHPDLVKVGA